MTKSSHKRVFTIILAVFFAVTALLAVAYFFSQWKAKDSNIANAGTTITNYEESRAIYIGDTRYLPDPDIFTFLLVGVDKLGAVEESNSYNNNEQADFIALIAYDKNKNTCKILHINRDTMADVPVLGIAGKKAGTAFEQIALAHTYGDGTKVSARNTVSAIETLLGGITINNYAVMKMDAVKIINDEVGGVPVEITEDLTAIDPSFVKGATVNLLGDTALQYIRRRTDVSDGTNLSRMTRQQAYILSFYNQLKSKLGSNNRFISDTFFEANDYIVTDCDFARLNELQEYISNFPDATIYEIPGDAKMGDEYVEYYVDEDKLKQLCVDLFYVEANK